MDILASKSVGYTQKQYFTFAEEAPMLLDSGETLGPVTLAYETYGRLNADRSNAILICHALSGDSHVAGYYTRQDSASGWWDDCVGPGKAFDTNRFFVICSNIIGGCAGSTGPGSVNPKTGKPYGLGFPLITIGDIVRAQANLVDALGIKKLLAVVGGSMGGMQALQWAVAYPQKVCACLPIATTARHSPMLIAFSEVGRQAIYADPNWKGGDYYGSSRPNAGLAVARMVGHITYLSEQSMHHKFGRRLQTREHFGYDFETDFAVESYLRHKGNRFTERFDANSYLYITKALDYFDLANGVHSLVAAFANSTNPLYLVISFTSDWLYPAYHSKELVSSLTAVGADVTYVNIQSSWGHDAFLLEVDTMTGLLTNFLGRVVEQFKIALPPPPIPNDLSLIVLPEVVDQGANQADMMA